MSVLPNAAFNFSCFAVLIHSIANQDRYDRIQQLQNHIGTLRGRIVEHNNIITQSKLHIDEASKQLMAIHKINSPQEIYEFVLKRFPEDAHKDLTELINSLKHMDDAIGKTEQVLLVILGVCGAELIPSAIGTVS